VYVCVCVFLYAACVGVINDEDANEILLMQMSSDVLWQMVVGTARHS